MTEKHRFEEKSSDWHSGEQQGLQFGEVISGVSAHQTLDIIARRHEGKTRQQHGGARQECPTSRTYKALIRNAASRMFEPLAW